MKLVSTIVLMFLLSSLVGQSNDRLEVPFTDVNNPLTGGFEAPQFQAIELDGDGKKDLLIFDRKGGAIRTFIRDETFETGYRYAPEYEDVFPAIPCWVKVRDYDQDGIDDLFTCGVTDPVTGIEVWKGKRENGKLSFEVVNHPNGPYNILYYGSEFDYRQLYVGNNGIPGIRDIDGDGDIDILAFQPSGGYLYYFKNMSQERGFGNDSLVYERADDCWGNFYEGGLVPDIILSDNNNDCALPSGLKSTSKRHEGITLSIFDRNNDGLQDLLIGEVSSNNLIYVENGGTADDAFATYKEVNFPSTDIPADIQIFLGTFNIDIDQDGNEDLIVAPNSQFGTNTEQVSYYRNVDGDYQLVQEDWLVDHTLDFGTDSYPAFFDYNADGLMDLVIGSYGLVGIETGAQTRLYLYENEGTVDEPIYTLKDDNYLNFLAFSEFDKSYNPTFGDLDGDGDGDLMLGTLSGELIYVDNLAGAGNPAEFGNPVFDYKGLDLENNTIRTAIVDLNRDGLGDLVVGGRNSYSLEEGIGSLKFFPNMGTIGSPIFSDDNYIKGLGKVNMKDIGNSRVSAAPRFYQNGDQTLLFVSNEIGRIAVYNVDGVDGTYELINEDLLDVRFGRRVAVDVADIDNDGYLEIVAGNERGGLNFFNTVVQVSGEISSVKDELKAEFKVYPNPASSYINISGEEGEILIYNNLGQFVKRITSSNNSVDISSLRNGIYFLKSADRVAKFLKI